MEKGGKDDDHDDAVSPCKLAGRVLVLAVQQAQHKALKPGSESGGLSVGFVDSKISNQMGTKGRPRMRGISLDGMRGDAGKTPRSIVGGGNDKCPPLERMQGPLARSYFKAPHNDSQHTN